MKKGFIIYCVITTALSGTTLWSVFRYADLYREKQILDQAFRKTEFAVSQMRNAVVDLEGEKKNLSSTVERQRRANKELQAALDEAEIRNAMIKQDMEHVQAKLVETEVLLSKTSEDLSSLQHANQELMATRHELEGQLDALVREKIYLERELTSSSMMFREQVKDFKQKVRDIKKEVLDAQDREDAAIGNNGYMMRNGHSTFHKRVTIRVLPADL